MRYSINKRYGFLSFAKKISKNLSNKYGQKLLDSARKFKTDAKKIASRRAIQETAEATNDLTGNKIADKLQALRKSLQRNCVQKMMMLIVQQKYQIKKKDIYLQN